MKKILFGIMAVAMMASCSSEENVGGEPGTGEVKKVSIVVKNAALTRAFADAENTPVANNLKFFFTTSSGVITNQFDEVAAKESYGPYDVATSAQKLYVVANAEGVATISAEDGANISTVEATVFSLENQTIEGAILYGSNTAAFELDPDAGANHYKTSVRIAPSVARIQIAKVSSKPVQNGEILAGDVKGFTLKGIYVDHYYQNATIGGEGNTMVDLDWSTTPSFSSWMCTEFEPATTGTPSGNFVEVVPAEKTYWDYAVAAGEASHIVLHLETVTRRNVLDTDDIVENDQYVEVLTFNKDGEPVTTFEPGTIYRIGNIQFSTDNLTPEPGIEAKYVTATVEVVKWAVEEITPEL